MTVRKPLSFTKGDQVVYPGHGVGVVNSLKSKKIAGTKQNFIEITIADNGMKIMVPLVQAESVGLRKVASKGQVSKVYSILKDRETKIDTQTWNRRFREYSQKIKTGSLYEIAKVIRDLKLLSNDKDLSFGEKKMLESAEKLLVSELCIIKSESTDAIQGEITGFFN